jgi:hypothetical protein
MTLITVAVTFPLLLTLGYVCMCAAAPSKDCRRCGGFGFELWQDRKVRTERAKDRRRCETTAKRIRADRWLLNRRRAVRRDGTR